MATFSPSLSPTGQCLTLDRPHPSDRPKIDTRHSTDIIHGLPRVENIQALKKSGFQSDSTNKTSIGLAKLALPLSDLGCSVPLTPYCRKIVALRDHACLGISPFNSFFSESKMRSLFFWAAETFDSFTVFLPDTPFVHTFEALGYSHQKAKKKVHKQIRYLRNKINRALEGCPISQQKMDDMILDFSKLSENPYYQEKYREVKFCFEHDSRFRHDCLEASALVLGSKIQGEIKLSQKRKAVEYLLAEIPVISGSSEICGAKSSVFCYYHSVPLFVNLFSGVYEYQSSPKQAFLVVGENL